MHRSTIYAATIATGFVALGVLANADDPYAYGDSSPAAVLIAVWLVVFVPIAGVAALWRARASIADALRRALQDWARGVQEDTKTVVTYQRERVPERVKNEVWRRDRGRCAECESRERLEFDHIVPVSKGGSNTARNLELLCQACNRRKGAMIG